MTASRRIGILLFLYSRNELSPAEQEELLIWRRGDPENEKLFFEMTDPESLRSEMKLYYGERDLDFEKLKARMPELSDTRLSGTIEGAAEIFSEVQVLEDEDASDPAKNENAYSGLTPIEYWGSMLSHLDDSDEEHPGKAADNKVVPISPDLKPLRVRRKGRSFRRFLRVAASVISLFMCDYALSDHRYNYFRAEMVSSDGVISKFSQDFWRGFLAGMAGIKFGETEKGEPIYIAANEHKAKKDKFYTLFTGPGGEFILQLPDSTMVWMNAASTIKYPANFDQDTIRLEVEGEVYIERSKDTKHHYLIRRSTITDQRPTTNGQPPTIEAPASFGININNYPGKNEMRVTLIRGAAMAKPATTEKNFQLLNGQQAVIIRDSLADTRNVNAFEVTAWKENEFYFNEADLQTIMPAIAHWYGVGIGYAGGIPDKKFSFRMPRSESLSGVLDSLRKQGLRITLRDKTLTIWN
jgi:hypothetical protein